MPAPTIRTRKSAISALSSWVRARRRMFLFERNRFLWVVFLLDFDEAVEVHVVCLDPVLGFIGGLEVQVVAPCREGSDAGSTPRVPR